MTGMVVIVASTHTKPTSRAELQTNDSLTHVLLQGSSLPPRSRPTSWTETAKTDESASAISTKLLIIWQLRIGLVELWITSQPTTRANTEIGTCKRNHQRL